MTFWDNIFFAFLFFVPAGLANLFPIFAAHTPMLKRFEFPMDFNLTFRGRRLFGANKTMRGLIVGILAAMLAALAQTGLYSHWTYLRHVSPIDYSHLNPLLLGLLLGLGALCGDAIESFFKRQFDIQPGERLFLFDQLDYVLGVILFTYWYVPLSLGLYGYMAGVWFVIHILTTTAGYYSGFKEKPI
ncbi:MAG TPA: CDP-archaeol synthase [Patescibacteria group bacterium]|jgi:CDP-2,3-bis-(O-geranylgeranyl)-sn-glycerol synthase|nr:CDP-archaeol synthase [Patescibacteria group bacterium]